MTAVRRITITAPSCGEYRLYMKGVYLFIAALVFWLISFGFDPLLGAVLTFLVLVLAVHAYTDFDNRRQQKQIIEERELKRLARREVYETIQHEVVEQLPILSRRYERAVKSEESAAIDPWMAVTRDFIENGLDFEIENDQVVARHNGNKVEIKLAYVLGRVKSGVRRHVRQQVIDAYDDGMDAQQFTGYVAESLSRFGWNIGPIDQESQSISFVVERNGDHIAVLCDKPDGWMDEDEIERLYEAKEAARSDKAAVISSSEFTIDAQSLAFNKHVQLLHYTKMDELGLHTFG